MPRVTAGSCCACVCLCAHRAAELVAARRTCCEALGGKFEAPLKEAVSQQTRGGGPACQHCQCIESSYVQRPQAFGAVVFFYIWRGGGPPPVGRTQAAERTRLPGAGPGSLAQLLRSRMCRQRPGTPLPRPPLFAACVLATALCLRMCGVFLHRCAACAVSPLCARTGPCPWPPTSTQSMM
jgi:hypothetical protein